MAVLPGIFLETHGTGTSCSFGSFAFTITNYFVRERTSQWFGSVWAPYAGINIGSRIQLIFYHRAQCGVEPRLMFNAV